MSSTDSTDQILSQVNFTGGFPTSADLAPSIVFLVIYAFSLPLFVFRLVRKESRTPILFRPAIFLACRLGMLVLRAVMAKTTYGEGELIAELVLVSIGFLFLIDPLIGIWERHLASAVTKDAFPTYVKRLALILRVLLIAAIGTAIAGSVLISSALESTSLLQTVKDLRQASAILCLVTVVVVAVAISITHVHFRLDARRTAYLAIPTACLIIVAVYRVVQLYTTDASAAVRSKAAFWILQILFELVAYGSLVAIRIPTFYPGAEEAVEGYQLDDAEAGRDKELAPRDRRQ